MSEATDYKQNFINWNQFCEIAKSEYRYTFFLNEDSNGKSLANALSQIWNCFKQEELLIIDLTPDIPIYRGRKFEKLPTEPYNAKMLGTPSKEYAKSFNRFNSVGLPVFYGAFKKETVKKEVNGNAQHLVIGEFHLSKTIKILDLVEAMKLSKSILLSEQLEKSKANDLFFFYSLAESLNLPAENELDYIPTQIFAEYVRRVGERDFGIRGIKYPSVGNPGGENIVLFYDNNHCVDNVTENDDYLILEKTFVYERKISYVKHKKKKEEY